MLIMQTRKFRNSLLLPLLTAGVLICGCQQQATDSANQAPKTVEVDVITLHPQPQKMATELPGRTVAFRIAEVRPQVNGIIKERCFKEGSEVKVGDLLYQIDPATYKAEYESAKAALAKARATEKSARLKADRYRSLVKTKAVSELDQVDAEAAWQEAIADVAAAQAALNTAKINLDYTRITAPISGRIGKSMITEGALVAAQQTTALAVIQQLDPIYVDVTQSTTEIAALQHTLNSAPPTDGGQSSAEDNKADVSILLTNGSLYPRQGSLEFSDVTVEQTTGTITLRAIVPNPKEELLPGMFVRARIDTGTNENAILVPSSGISRNKRGQAVAMLVNDQSLVESRVIETGETFGDKTLVTSGLQDGEQFITAGFQFIKPGLTVKATNQTKDNTVAAVSQEKLQSYSKPE